MGTPDGRKGWAQWLVEQGYVVYMIDQPMRGRSAWHPGDGGFIMKLSDGTVTDSSWKAQSFYIAPLKNPDDVIEKGNEHDTTKLGRIHPHAPKPGCEDKCFAVHYPIPANWAPAG